MLDEGLDELNAHLASLRIAVRSAQLAATQDPESSPSLLDDIQARCDSLSEVTAEVAALVRRTHTLDPLLGVPEEAVQSAAGLVTAFFDGTSDGDFVLLSSMIEDILLDPKVSFRELAGILAALSRHGALMACSPAPPGRPRLQSHVARLTG